MALRSSATDTPPPPAPPRSRRPIALWIGLAFLVGLVLFAVMVLRDGKKDHFFRSETAPAAGTGPDYAPLPAPFPGADADTVGLPPPDPEAVARQQEAAEAARAASVAPRRVEQPKRVTSTKAEPIPGETPPPRYPAQALRRGEEGTVIVRAEIGPDGIPTSVSLSAGSGSRVLDRVALEAVKGWRFKPATENGRPTVGSVLIPIDFTRQ